MYSRLPTASNDEFDRRAAPTRHDTTLVKAVRNDVVQATQRKDAPRLKAICDDLIRNQMWRSCDLDEILLLHNIATFPNLNLTATALLNDYGCSPLYPDGNGDTVAHYAIRANNVALLKALYDRVGSRIFDVRNSNGFTILLTAAAESSDLRAYEVLTVLEWLYLHGVSLEVFDNRGRTGLFWASQRGSLVLVQWFLSRGANLAHRDFAHRTALMVACIGGVREVVQCLCAIGAINLLKCRSNDTAGTSTAMAICHTRSNYFLGLTLRLWYASWKLLRKLSFFNSQYGWYYVGLNVINFFVYLVLFYRLANSRYNLFPYCITFLVLFIAAQVFWLLTCGADPGYVKTKVLPSQAYRCSPNAREDLRMRGVFSYRINSACAKLQTLEQDNALLAYDIGSVYRQFRINPTSLQCLPTSGPFYEAVKPLSKRVSENNRTIAALRGKVAGERQSACPSAYPDAVLSCNPKRVCLTCRLIKPFRAHHCGDCGHCVHRFDHHCVWVDNCIGSGNQRAFLCFLATLWASILWLWVLVILDIREGFNEDYFEQPLSYLIIANSFLNIVWGGFVGYLLLRTFKSMISNVTFYEYLKLPSHVVRRFRGRVSGCCWELSDLTPIRCLRNIFSFCTRSEKYDDIDYPGAAAAALQIRSHCVVNNNTSSASSQPAVLIGPTEPLLYT